MAKVTKTNPLGAGRTPADIQDAIRKLKPFLQVGYSFWKACQIANVPYTTYIYYYNNDDDFRSEIEYERTKVNIIARQNIIKSIQGATDKDGKVLKEPDVKNSFEWLDRMEKDEFSKRVELTGPQGIPLFNEDNPKVLETVLKTYDAIKKWKDDVSDNTSE